jgi:predicted transcriptional regulator
MKLHHRQRGLGVIQLIFIIGLLVAGWIFLPIYMEHGKVKSALKVIPQQNVIKPGSTSSAALKNVRAYLTQDFYQHKVVHVPPHQINVIRDERGYEVNVKYDVHRPLSKNVNIVVSFNDSVHVPMVR